MIFRGVRTPASPLWFRACHFPYALHMKVISLFSHFQMIFRNTRELLCEKVLHVSLCYKSHKPILNITQVISKVYPVAKFNQNIILICPNSRSDIFTQPYTFDYSSSETVANQRINLDLSSSWRSIRLTYITKCNTK